MKLYCTTFEFLRHDAAREVYDAMKHGELAGPDGEPVDVRMDDDTLYVFVKASERDEAAEAAIEAVDSSTGLFIGREIREAGTIRAKKHPKAYALLTDE